MLREAIIEGEWRAATQLLHAFGGDASNDVVGPFLDGLTAPGAQVTRHAVAALDRQDEQTAAAFMDLSLAFGPRCVQWLMHLLAESQDRRTREALLRTITTLVQDRPDVLLPWLSDSRWYVVRNVVHIYSAIGGDAVGGFVEAVIQHPEPRVRREVVDVLGKCDPDLARPILSRMAEGAEPRLFGAIMQRLAQDPSEDVTALLLSAFERDRFTRRSAEEKRAILMAMATRGDVVLPVLDAALHRGGVFARGQDDDRQAIALCMARIGSEDARRRLEHGERSGSSGVRRFCGVALKTMGGDHG